MPSIGSVVKTSEDRCERPRMLSRACGAVCFRAATNDFNDVRKLAMAAKACIQPALVAAAHHGV